MKLIGFDHEGTRHIGAIDDANKVRNLGSATTFYSDPATALRSSDGALVDVAELKLEPAVPITSRIFCVGINYRSHATESKDLAGLDEPKLPMIFGRWQQTLVTNGVPVPVPPNEQGLDWEVELAAVIGTQGWNIAEDRALDHVLGYAAFNDLSARKKQLETPQFTVGKNADLSGPISEIVTADELGDIAGGLEVITRVNGEIMQQGNTRDLIHTVEKIISYITDTITLQPGDVIATGTPGGVGAGRKPPVFLVPGDEVTVSVEKVGTVTNPIVGRAS